MSTAAAPVAPILRGVNERCRRPRLVPFNASRVRSTIGWCSRNGNHHQTRANNNNNARCLALAEDGERGDAETSFGRRVVIGSGVAFASMAAAAAAVAADPGDWSSPGEGAQRR